SLPLPALKTVGADLGIAGNDKLTTLSLPVLATVGAFYVNNNTALTSLHVPSSLTHVTNDINFRGNSVLGVIDGFAGLTTVGEGVSADNGYGESNVCYGTKVASASVGGCISLDGAPGLQVTLSGITSATSVYAYNGNLASLSMPSLTS